MTPPRPPLFRLLLAVALGVLAVAVLVSAADLYHLTLIGVLNPIDEMAYADMARVAADGGVPFREIWDIKPPVNTYLLAAFVRALGNTVLTVRIAVLAQAAAFVILTTALAVSATRSWAAGAFALVMSLSMAATASFFEGWEPVMLVAVFTTAAALVLVRGAGGPVASFWAGMLLAVAFYTKPVVAPEGFALVALAALLARPGRRWSAAGMVVVGGLAGLGLFALLWWYQGVLLSVWRNAFGNSFLYAFEAGAEGSGGGFWHFDAAFRGYFEQYFLAQTLPFLAPLLVLALPATLALARSREHRPLLFVVLGWLLAQVLGALVGQSMRRTYFLQVLPSLLLLNALAVPLFLRWRAPFQAALLALLAAGLWAGGTITNMRGHVQNLAALTWRSPDQADWVQQAQPTVIALRGLVPADGCFWAWDNIGLVRYLAERVACTPEHAAHLMMVRESFDYRRIRAEYLNGLFAARPTIHTRYEVWGYFPELQRFADRYLGERLFAGYQPYGTVDIFAVDMSPFRDHNASFGGLFSLVGYDLYTPQAVCAGDTVRLSLTWRAEATPTRYYNTFVQLLTADETAQIAGIDTQPHSDRPTIAWDVPGMLYLGDTLALTVPPTTPPGTYTLVHGFYDVETLERLAAYDADGAALPGGYVRLTPLDVAACAG